MYLKLLAVLLTKEGGRRRTEDSEREVFIAERVRSFSTVSAAIALEVDFFLLYTLPSYGERRLADISLSLSALSLPLQIQNKGKQRWRPSRGRKRKTEKFSAESDGAR